MKSWFITCIGLHFQLSVICSPHRVFMFCLSYNFAGCSPPRIPMRAKGAKEAAHGENAVISGLFKKKNIPSARALKASGGEHFQFRICTDEGRFLHRVTPEPSVSSEQGAETHRPLAKDAFSWRSAVCQVVVATGVAGRGRVRFSCVLIDMKPLIHRVREKTFSQTTTSDSILSGSETVKLHFCFFCFPAVWYYRWSVVPRNEVKGCYHSIRWVWW